VISKYYKNAFPESFDNSLKDDVVYIGKHRLTDETSVQFKNEKFNTNIGKLILSPTRTFAPLLKEILESDFDAIDGLIHCSGGGQTKCMKYLPENVKVIKDNLFNPPEIFQIIQESSGADEKEMYQVFNMGCRMEIYTNEKNAGRLTSIANEFGIDAQVIGRVEESKKTELIIRTGKGEIQY
jgi:phosphoribosylformylglycinamidine cyclo-ligase